MIEILKPTLEKIAEYQLEMYQRESIQFDTKSTRNDFVSEVDINSQEMLVKAIKKQFPEAGILAEESYQENILDNEYVFVIDPLDGTSNFRSKLDNWAISIGLLKDGKVFEGIINFPIHRKTVISHQLSVLKDEIRDMKKLNLFGVDRKFEALKLGIPDLKRRLLGATVPTVYHCLQTGMQGDPGLDFAVLGTSKIWDIAGIAACVKANGGVMLTLSGEDLLESNLLDLYNQTTTYDQTAIPYIVSGSPSIAGKVLLYIQN